MVLYPNTHLLRLVHLYVYKLWKVLSAVVFVVGSSGLHRSVMCACHGPVVGLGYDRHTPRPRSRHQPLSVPRVTATRQQHEAAAGGRSSLMLQSTVVLITSLSSYDVSRVLLINSLGSNLI